MQIKNREDLQAVADELKKFSLKVCKASRNEGTRPELIDQVFPKAPKYLPLVGLKVRSQNGSICTLVRVGFKKLGLLYEQHASIKESITVATFGCAADRTVCTADLTRALSAIHAELVDTWNQDLDKKRKEPRLRTCRLMYGGAPFPGWDQAKEAEALHRYFKGAV